MADSASVRTSNSTGRRRRDFEPDGTCTCRVFWIGVFVITFFIAFFSSPFLIGSFLLMFDVYGSNQMEIGLNSSYLLKENKLLVERISVRNIDQVPGVRLYLFENQPSLNKTEEWSVERNVVISGNHHKEWVSWLNKGSEVKLVYELPSTSSLLIIVAKGKSQFSDWVRDPSSPGSCSLWRSARGHGKINFEADSDNDYYFGLGNIHEESVEMKFRMEIKSKRYETETANSWCPVDVKSCKILPSLRGSKVGLLTAPDRPQEGCDLWRVEVSYRTRWQTHLIFYGAYMFLLFLLFFGMCFFCEPKDMSNLSPEETPLNSQQHAYTRSQKANTISNSKHKVTNSQISSNTKTVLQKPSEENICVICFEKKKDSIMQPCAHFATCYGCGLRIKEAFSQCPICRNLVEDIKKIFNV